MPNTCQICSIGIKWHEVRNVADSHACMHAFTHSMPSNPLTECSAADILWQAFSLPCLRISFPMWMKALQTAGLFSQTSLIADSNTFAPCADT